MIRSRLRNIIVRAGRYFIAKRKIKKAVLFFLNRYPLLKHRLHHLIFTGPISIAAKDLSPNTRQVFDELTASIESGKH